MSNSIATMFAQLPEEGSARTSDYKAHIPPHLNDLVDSHFQDYLVIVEGKSINSARCYQTYVRSALATGEMTTSNQKSGMKAFRRMLTNWSVALTA